ncbi:glycerate kinase type-2 family protein [Tunturibacter empetritectus]|uniref:glycerate kinase type-2 family protein n=1 Tax=Tunturiibacter empetritectus TaxID=3069691 RepID=UPI0021A573F3|nr:DUF4147 domain-containing protein [Edaphobacter lichenicola]
MSCNDRHARRVKYSKTSSSSYAEIIHVARHGKSQKGLGGGSLPMISAALDLGEIARALFRYSLADCSIERAFSEKIKSRTDGASRRYLLFEDDPVDLSRLKHIRVLAAGKAATPMLEALLPHLQNLPQCEVSGVLVTAERPEQLPENFQFFAGGHPLPNQASVDAARAALQVLQTLKLMSSRPDDALCVFLISGGASAMLELPLDSTISLEDTVSFYRELVHCGASIAEINCVRKHFSAIKGGRLAMHAEGILSYSLLISDVPVGHLDALASGPTLPDTSTVEQCREILARYDLMKRFPASLRRFFGNPGLPETPKAHQFSARSLTLITSDDLAEATRRRAESIGFYAVIDNTCDDWDYCRAAVYLLERLRSLRRDHARVCLISSGEVTVELPEGSPKANDVAASHRLGIGGRNQHFALYAATLLQSSAGATVVLSAGTDGIDGNSIAAGAVVGELTLLRSNGSRNTADSGLLRQAELALQHFDSGTFLKTVGSSIVTGATGNNLRDLRILLCV